MGTEAHQRAVVHAARRLLRISPGEFRLEGAPGEPYRFRPSSDAWTVIRDDGSEACRFTREGAWRGLVLYDGSEELGRSNPPLGLDGGSGMRFVLLNDGRLFRMVQREPGVGGFDLLGWETPGAYIEARQSAGEWTLQPTAASGGLRDIENLMLIFSAELLELERDLQTDGT